MGLTIGGVSYDQYLAKGSLRHTTARNSEPDKILYFNQEDHIRMFGSDFRDRLKAPGFEVEEFTAVEPYVSRHALIRGEKVFLCRKPR